MREIPIIDTKATGEKIRQLREAAGLSVMELQKRMGRIQSPQAVYRWEYGRTLPTLDNLVVLADALGVTLDDIIVTIRVPISEADTPRGRNGFRRG